MGDQKRCIPDHRRGRADRSRPIDSLRPSEAAWLRISFADCGLAVIKASGALDAERAEVLWDSIEYALADKPGRRVIVDLSDINEFDDVGIRELTVSARTAARRHDDLRLVVDSSSFFGHYLNRVLSAQHWPLYRSLSDAYE